MTVTRFRSFAASTLFVALLATPLAASGAGLSAEERTGLVAALESSLRDFEELVADVSDEEWLRKPAPEKWSVGEVAEHILLSERLLFGSIQETLEGEPDPDWEAATEGKMERIEQFMPDRSIKAQAPGPLEPTGELGREECLAAFAAARAETLDFVRGTELEIKRFTRPHPADFFGELNVHQWLHFMAAHHGRHNLQIAEVEEWLELDRHGLTRVSETGFGVRHETTVGVTADEAYRALVDDVGSWWQSDHTFSGDAANLSIDARPGGCFCESLPDGGGVTHLTVVHADPGKLLRLAGGLGPLQSEAVAGSLSWSLEATEAGTRITLTYNVAGEVEAGLAAWARPVAGVLKAQLDGLAEHLSRRAATELPSDPFELAFEEIDDGIWLAHRPDMPRYPVVGNAVIVVGDESVALVDGGGSVAVAEQIAAAIKRRTDRPLTHLIVSHWHSDHTIGLDVFPRHYPGVSIVAHRWTRDRIASTLTERVESMGRSARETIDRAEKLLTAGVSEDGEPLEAARRDYLARMVADREAIVRDRDEASAGVPDTVVDDSLILDTGGRRLEVRFLGRANSPGDLVVYLPRERILIGGDIVTHPVPFGFPKYPTELVESIDRLLEIDFDRLVPGHGPVLHGKSYARAQRELVDRTNRRIAALIDEGLELEQIRSSLDFSGDALPFTGGDDRIAFFFDRWYAGPVVERTYNELTGQVR